MRKTNIYISSSWENREAVRKIAAKMRQQGYEVYDFSDPTCRNTSVIPAEGFPNPYDPSKGTYSNYLNNVPNYFDAVIENKRAVDNADLIVLLLPCDDEAYAEWAYGIGTGNARSLLDVLHPVTEAPCTCGRMLF